MSPERIPDAEDILLNRYSIVLISEGDGSFSAEVLEFPGCFAEGETADEAVANVHDAAAAWVEGVHELGQTVPEPLDNQGYGGKVALRLPRSLHRQASRMAERDGVSLNQFLVTAIALHVGAMSESASHFSKSLTAATGTMTNKALIVEFAHHMHTESTVNKHA